jgi:hypothetical protein
VNRDVVDPGSRLWTQGPNINGSSDKTVAVVKLETPEGKPIAAYIDCAMHPVNGYLAGFTSADFAGATSRYVEQAYGDKMVAVFVQGASGNQNPLYLARRRMPWRPAVEHPSPATFLFVGRWKRLCGMARSRNILWIPLCGIRSNA